MTNHQLFKSNKPASSDDAGIPHKGDNTDIKTNNNTS